MEWVKKDSVIFNLKQQMTKKLSFNFKYKHIISWYI